MSYNKAIISNILEIYKKLAANNPQKLRRLIPTNEIWRFFIDGNEQPVGRKLSKYLNYLPLNNYVYSIYQYALQIEKLDLEDKAQREESKIDTLLRRHDYLVSIDDLKTTSFADLFALDNAWLPFEYNEQGYLRAVCRAFQELFITNKKIDNAFIKKLHLLSTQNVSNLNYQKSRNNKPGEFRVTDTMFFPLYETNCSPAGLEELIKKIKLGNSFNSIGIKFHQYTLIMDKTLIDKLTSAHSALQINDEDILSEVCLLESESDDVLIGNLENEIESILDCCKNIAGLSDKALARYFYVLIHDKKCEVSLYSEQEKNTQATLEMEMQHLNVIYQDAIKIAKTPEEKLFAIVRYVKDCEQLHPFIDANCRTFCMLLLNALLLENGFPLTMLRDPNQFDCYSIEELILEVLQGMHNTFKLIEFGQAFNVRTNNVLHELYKRNKFQLLKYFQDITKQEELSRYLMNKSCYESLPFFTHSEQKKVPSNEQPRDTLRPVKDTKVS